MGLTKVMYPVASSRRMPSFIPCTMFSLNTRRPSVSSYSRAFSMAIAAVAASDSTSLKSVGRKRFTSVSNTWSTPITCSFTCRGTLSIDRCSSPICWSTFSKWRSSARVSGTIRLSPLVATLPAIPSPGASRQPRATSLLWPTACWQTSSFVSGSTSQTEAAITPSRRRTSSRMVMSTRFRSRVDPSARPT